MVLFRNTVFFTLALALAGCGSSSSSGDGSAEPEDKSIVENCAGGDNLNDLVFSLYDANVASLALPFPNDLYMGSDGTIDMPLPANVLDGDYSNPIVAINSLDGFSTTAPISMDFSATIDVATVCAGTNVRVYKVNLDENGIPTTIVSELVAGTDYEASVSNVDNTRLLVKPLLPLTPKSAYLVAVTIGLSSTGGGKFTSSDNYASLAGSDTIAEEQATARSMVQAQQSALLDSKGIASSDVVVSFSFSTQSITDVLTGLEASTEANGPVNYSISRAVNITKNEDGSDKLLTTNGFFLVSLIYGLTAAGQSDIYTGTISTPYYLEIPASSSDDKVKNSYFKAGDGSPLTRNNTQPVVNATLSMPLLLTLPNTSLDPGLVKPVNGWPVAIYHHGSGGNRTNALLIADALASQGIATIAIDQPLHGALPSDAFALPLNLIDYDFYDANNERHFNLDLDGTEGIDPSGAYFSSVNNMLTGRASYRQAVSDLMHLVKTIPSMKIDGESATLFDDTKIQFVGLSLGSMVGILFSAMNTDFKAASLSVPGAGGIKGSEGSPSFHDGLLAALSSIGLEQGTIEYENYLTYATTITDASDTINFAALANINHPIHMTEIIGDGANNLPDQTVPNHVLNTGSYTGLVVETAPLAGTDALIRVMGLTAVSSSIENAMGRHVAVRFTDGDHQSQVSPLTVAAATKEIQAQTASFLASSGQNLTLDDSSIIEAQ